MLAAKYDGRSKKIKYLVQWKGYGPEDNTWEPEGHLAHAQEALKDFYKQHPGAPRNVPNRNCSLVFKPIPEPFTESTATLVNPTEW